METSRQSRFWAALVRYTGPHAFSYIVGLLVLVPLSIGTALSDVDRLSDDWLAWVFIGGRAFFASFALFLLLGLALRWVPVGGVRSVLVLLTFGLVEAARAVLVERLAAFAGVPVTGELWFRFAAGFFTGLALFSLASILVNDAKIYRRDLFLMRTTEQRLRSLLMRSSQELSAVRAELLRGVRETVDEAMRAILRPKKTAASAQEVVDTLLSVSEGVVRPISHDLHNNPRVFPEETSPPLRSRVRVSDVVALATTVDPYRPGFTSVLSLLLATPPLIFGLGVWTGLLASAVLVAAIFVFLGLGRIDARRRYRKLRVATRVALMTLTFAALGVTMGVAFTLLNVWSGGFSWTSMLYVAVLAPLLCWMLVIPVGIQAARADVLRNTVQFNDALRWELARANALIWQEQQELSSTLHRDIQGTLLASAFRLKQVIESGGDAQAAIDEIRTILSDSVDLMKSPSGPDTLHQLCSELSDRWLGVLDIHANYSGATRAVIERDRVVMRAIRDIAGEFATNAIKHGRAHTMALELDMRSSHEVLFTLTNDGRPRDSDATPGLGTILIENLATEVTFHSTTSGVSLTVVLPTGNTSTLTRVWPLVPVA